MGSPAVQQPSHLRMAPTGPHMSPGDRSLQYLQQLTPEPVITGVLWPKATPWRRRTWQTLSPQKLPRLYRSPGHSSCCAGTGGGQCEQRPAHGHPGGMEGLVELPLRRTTPPLSGAQGEALGRCLNPGTPHAGTFVWGSTPLALACAARRATASGPPRPRAPWASASSALRANYPTLCQLVLVLARA